MSFDVFRKIPYACIEGDRMQKIIEILRRNELFSDLPSEIVESISSRLSEIIFAAEETICNEGDPGDRMYIIMQGEAVVLRDTEWGQRELKRIGEGEIFGEMALISRETRSATVMAAVSTTCLQLEDSDFSNLLSQYPRFAQRVAQVLTKRLSAMDRKTTEELVDAHRALIFALANLAETRDPETGSHLYRTRSYCAMLADKLGSHPSYRELVFPGFIDSIYHVSPLHDIGKVAIPDSILLKPGRLTDEEFEVMKGHSKAGAKALEMVLDYSDQDIFRMASRICMHHHERWDGTGYPGGLKSDDIPLEARIMALSDVYDALTSKRVYKAEWTHQDACDEMRRSAGTQFDPDLVEIMLDNIDGFEKIRKRYSD